VLKRCVPHAPTRQKIFPIGAEGRWQRHDPPLEVRSVGLGTSADNRRVSPPATTSHRTAWFAPSRFRPAILPPLALPPGSVAAAREPSTAQRKLCRGRTLWNLCCVARGQALAPFPRRRPRATQHRFHSVISLCPSPPSPVNTR